MRDRNDERLGMYGDCVRFTDSEGNERVGWTTDTTIVLGGSDRYNVLLEDGSVHKVSESELTKVSEPEEMPMWIGMPMTYCIGGDRYAGEVLGFTKSHKTIETTQGTFTWKWGRKRFSSKGKDFGGIIFGSAEDHRDPHF